jgi:hypothetical protein
MDGCDSFEKRLHSQKHAAIPTAWRAEVLVTARKNAEVEPTASAILDRASSVFWRLIRQLLWPHPAAWGSLAAVWVCVFAIEISMQEPSTETRPRAVIAANSSQTRQMLLAQRRLFSELIAEEPKRALSPSATDPEHHSRRDDDFKLA